MPNSQDSIVIYGEPMHADAAAIVARYRRDSLTDFLATEARHGIGNYALVETRAQFCRIVTSPGYCGGYLTTQGGRFVAGTLLSDVLGAMRGQVAAEPFALSVFLNRAVHSSFGQFPVSSVFKGVDRIPPCSVVEFANGSLTCHCSYLLRGVGIAPRSFEEAIEETSNTLADYYSRTRKMPMVMFSGGVDSLLIYLSLRNKIDKGRIRAATMDHSPTNGPKRAHPIAKKLNIDLEHYSLEALDSQASLAMVAKMMAKELISGRAPHLALGEANPGCDLLHGQNMDSMVKIDMTILQANLEKGYLSKPVETDEARLRQYETFLENLQFTHLYLDDPDFRKHTREFFSARKKLVIDADSGNDGLLRGLLSSQHPHLLVRSEFPKARTEFLNREAGRYKAYVGKEAVTSRFLMDVLRFKTYSHLAAKRLTTLALPDSSRVNLVAMAGPIVSYSIGRHRGLFEASQPKHEIYSLVEKYTGKPYSALASEEGGKHRYEGTSKRSDDNGKILESRLDLIRSGSSRLLKTIDHKTIKEQIEKYCSETTCDPANPHFSTYNQSRGRNLLNLELILREAEAKRQAMQLVA